MKNELEKKKGTKIERKQGVKRGGNILFIYSTTLSKELV